MFFKFSFIVDGSGAGSGDLEILVEGGRVTSSVRSLGGQRFKAAFTPHQALPHRVDIRFNGDTVPGKWIWIFFCSFFNFFSERGGYLEAHFHLKIFH